MVNRIKTLICLFTKNMDKLHPTPDLGLKNTFIQLQFKTLASTMISLIWTIEEFGFRDFHNLPLKMSTQLPYQTHKITIYRH